MNAYLLSRYLHVVGALGLFVALGLDWASLAQLRRARTAEQVREWARVLGWLRWLGPFSLAVTVLPGFYMAGAAWRGADWIGVSLAALLVVAALGALGSRRLGTAVKAATREAGALSPETRAILRSPLPWISVRIRAALLLGIVYLMTAKPGLVPSLWAMAVALAVAGAGAMLGRILPAEGAGEAAR